MVRMLARPFRLLRMACPQEVKVILVSETDRHVNPAGVKGLGELGNVGMAAFAGPVYHATGKRIRELPIRIDSLIA
jgi:xanthine dehydrogenase YagR molybdenum-binding subunit